MSKLKVGDFTSLPKLEDQSIVGDTKEEEAKVSIEESNYIDGVSKIEEMHYSEEKNIHGPFDEESPKKSSSEKEPTLYNYEELKEVVKNIAGSFFGSYISGYHPEQLRKGIDGIRKTAAEEVIQFSKVLLQELKKEE